jgi:hypothetical protein
VVIAVPGRDVDDHPPEHLLRIGTEQFQLAHPASQHQ